MLIVDAGIQPVPSAALEKRHTEEAEYNGGNGGTRDEFSAPPAVLRSSA
jgi:hypothetical protein